MASILVGTVIGGVFVFAILFGMHIPLFMIAIGMMTQTGYDSLILPGMYASVFALAGMEIGALLRMKRPEDRSLVASYILTHLVGGITEPAIFGIGLRYRKPLICSCIGAAIGSLFMGVVGARIYTIVASSSVVAVTGFVGGSTMNTILGISGLAIAMVSAGIITYLFGFKGIDLGTKE